MPPLRTVSVCVLLLLRIIAALTKSVFGKLKGSNEDSSFLLRKHLVRLGMERESLSTWLIMFVNVGWF